LKRGIGFTICPEVSVQNELKEKSLVRLNWNSDQYVVSLIMIWHVEKWCSPLLKNFMGLAKREISD
jgi:DNA-binding transcriptional LysR family regulator